MHQINLKLSTVFLELNPLKLEDCVWKEMGTHGGNKPGRSVAEWDGSPEEITATVKIFNNEEEYNKYRWRK